MLNDVCSLITKASLPKGKAWELKPDGDYEKTIDGIGEILSIICEKAEAVKNVRNPLLTNLLNDLEREYGVLKNADLNEDERRAVLSEKKYNSIIQGNPERLQSILQQIDSRIKVYQNSPAVDPTSFIGQGFLIIDTGRGDAAGGAIPANSWPFVFFVGGDVTRDVDGSILTMEELVLSIEREQLVTDAIIAYKGIYNWTAATLVIGVKGFIHDAVGNIICDAVGNQLYSLFEFSFDGNWVDESGNTFVDDSGNNFNFYY